jgi:hypothetical protein
MKCEEKNTVYRFRTLFKDLPLKYQNFTIKIPKLLPFTDFQTPHLDPLVSLVCMARQWRKFTFSSGGAKPSKFPTKLSNFRQTPSFALEKAVFSPLIGQNFRKFVISHRDFRHCGQTVLYGTGTI